MIKVSVNVDLSKAYTKLDLFSTSQVPYATALALTRTAQNVKAALISGMSEAFEKPTSYTLNALQVTRAEKKDENPTAYVGIKNADSGSGAIRWLRPEVFGGQRSYAIEALLRPLGLPPNGLYAVPGDKAKQTASGGFDINWFRSLVADIESQGVTQSRGTVTKTVKGTGRKRAGTLQYVVLLEKSGKLLPGIYGRRGRGIYPFVLFVTRPRYKAKFDFFGIGQRVATETFADEFDKAIKQAIDSAK